MFELEDARRRILSLVRPLGLETVPIRQALGRATGMAACATVDLPVFDNSAMDGYAVRAADLAGAAADHPSVLRLIGKAAAGALFEDAVVSGSCVRVFTGSPLPRGADAVVMQEDTRPDPTEPDRILVLDPVKPWENVRLQGEEVKRGTTLVEAGTRLSAGRIALLAAAGVGDLSVARRPRVSVLATGGGLVGGGAGLPPPGKIYESTRAMLAALTQGVGACPEILPLVPDTMEATRAALQQALAKGDAVVTSGGVSVGEYDLVRTAFENLGGEVAFWKVAIRPGKPFLFGQADGKLLFGLPGNPVSALVTFVLLVRPALAAMQGAVELDLPRTPCVLAEPLANRGDRRHFMRVILEDAGRGRSAR